jgi:hypothetical protein
MNLLEISWPVFRLGEHKPTIENNLVYYSKEYVDKESLETRIGLRIVDDKSVQGNTLGLRRLVITGARLFPIRQAIYFLGDLIKIAKQTTWFIDNTGKVFQYRKSSRAKLTAYKIKKVLPLEGMGAIIEVQGLPQRFKCMYAPKPEQFYAGILRWGLSYVLYGFYDEQFKATYRLV